MDTGESLRRAGETGENRGEKNSLGVGEDAEEEAEGCPAEGCPAESSGEGG